MMDEERQSVQVPISRALVALRRFRSLKDPTTNSMSKFSTLLENMNWETYSHNGISLKPEDGALESVSNRMREDRFASHNGSRRLKSWCMDSGQLGSRDIHKSLTGRYGSSNRDKALNLTYATPSASIAETFYPKSSRYKHEAKSSELVGDVSSCIGSSCPSVSESFSSHSESLFGKELAHGVDFDRQGCQMNCWPRTPNVEDYPLDTPRSLSQKFRPKSFDELVGQNGVVHSLFSAISAGRIASFYLFHGPRGTGKTCASRIFAASLNCISLNIHKPCGTCQECILFSSGRNRNIKSIDSARINRAERVRSLVKNASIPPVSSRFKVFIIDECQFLKEETWTLLLNIIDDLSQHVVFVMITPDVDNLPQSAQSRSQSCYFPKIKDADIASRLGKICAVEGLDHDRYALDVIAAKSNGSLRDAEMMLDQLSLLGKRITTSLVYELIGVVPDDELLELLDLALSSNTSNTVIMARELMRSRIDPMQLTSQLTNLITDILAGKISFYERYDSEADLQKLSCALKILSDAEKQLTMSKNQITWLTVTLLQLSSMESYVSYMNTSKLCLRKARDNGYDNCNISITGEGSKDCSSGDDEKTYEPQMQEDFKGTLETIWRNSTKLCKPNSLRSFLRKQGKLVSLCVNQGLAVAELEFRHSDYASRAEKSWKPIASSLQSILGCNVEIRINVASSASETKNSKAKKPSFRLFSCSRRMKHELQSTAEHENESYCSEHITEKPMIMDRVTTIRNSEGNVLSTVYLPRAFLQDDMPKCCLAVDSSKERETNVGTMTRSVQPRKKSFQACLCAARSCIFCCSSEKYSKSFRSEADYVAW